MDADEFAALAEQHRRELRVHCYRMLGSFDEAEDLVQETFLRAWRAIDGFEGRSTPRAWLYKIATNACLDVLAGRSRRVLPHLRTGPSDPRTPQEPREDIPWLQPFPDHLWEPAAPVDAEPDAEVIAGETIELAFLAALQHLPPRQRAALLLRDLLGWPAQQVARQLDTGVASVNSALQRARATLREHLPERRLDWPSPTEAERAVLRKYIEAMERADLAAVGALLAEDVRTTMPPWPLWFQGRDAVVAALTSSWDTSSPDYVGRFRMHPIAANHQLAVAGYVQRPGDDEFRAFAISLVRVEHDLVAEAHAFHDPALFPLFGLPGTWTDEFPVSSASQHG
ncbi:RNA polymerase subunit sigma-70 [Amycolatopsis sp. 195334CR]|uniref:RNA polymerase subunit sigma-70 n=1 Tax=Amycolatopsis sp. 195334CR TaxID=2814588 RepID=UPI001A8CF761|nr:RNA polymerase subunit sigma-70 [Amycolatopsis sp. 195334CR]MBN6039534.1 RNA polymerase subunit sigma-70 [Amycolatopsis sp. 195334CR]